MSALLTIPWFKLEGWTFPGTHIGIQPFGVLVAFAVWIGTVSATKHGLRNGMRREVVEDCATHVVIIGFILGHMFDMVFYYPQELMEKPWRIFFIWENLSSYGGVFGSIIGGFYWRWKRGVPLLPIYECIAYGFPLAWIFGRLGCFVVHDHPGRETDFFLGVENYQYPGLPVATRHDLGLYEVFWSIAVTLLFWLLSHKKRPWGFYSAMFALLYAPYRFGLDFLRVADKNYSGLTPGHYASFAALAIGISLLVYMRKHGNEPLVEAVKADTGLPWPPERTKSLSSARS